MFLCVALKIIKIIVTTITKSETGIQSGEKIHHHDHVIRLVSLSTKNIRNNTTGKDSPFLTLLTAIM